MEEFSDIPQPNLPTNEVTDIPIFNMPEIILPKIILPQPDKKAELLIASTSGISESSKTSEHIKPSNKKASSTSPARRQMMADADMVDFAKENKINPNNLFYMTRRERLISEEIYLWEYKDVGKPWKYVYDDEECQKNISILQKNGESLSRTGPKAEVNICQVSYIIPEGETIREMTQRIIWDNLSKKDVKAISRTLVETAFNSVVASSRLKLPAEILQAIVEMSKLKPVEMQKCQNSFDMSKLSKPKNITFYSNGG
ncbi:hypothetical protein C1646_767418 [Rhizophagus diaphanus]|nr:hypothetical protein C1646_767418 [Rhizophagus diaphanus] [Rhizophagus sp. MUCL 43196]